MLLSKHNDNTCYYKNKKNNKNYKSVTLQQFINQTKYNDVTWTYNDVTIGNVV